MYTYMYMYMYTYMYMHTRVLTANGPPGDVTLCYISKLLSPFEHFHTQSLSKVARWGVAGWVGHTMARTGMLFL